jgi:methyl-accepting chemotaxis protein
MRISALILWEAGNIMNKISGKLFVSYTVIIIIMICSILIGLKFLDSAETSGNELYDHYGVVQADAAMALSDFNEIKINIRNVLYLYETDADKQAENASLIEELKTEMFSYLDNVEAVPLSDECKEYLSEARANLEEYLSDVDTTLSYVEGQDMETAKSYFAANGVASANLAKEKLTQMISSFKVNAESVKDENHQQNSKSVLIMFLIMLVAVVFSASVARLVIHNIEKPISVLTKGAQQIAVGDTDVQIKKESEDEIGNLMENVAQMVDNIKKQEEIVNSIAEGDLRVQVELRSEKDSMNQALARMVADNNRVLNDINQATGQISNGSEQLSLASQTLAQGATQQASAIDQISASVKDISQKSMGNAEQTREAKQLVEEARSSALAGNDDMQEMVEAMKKINVSSENISKIIKVIDDIAFQTNILALNAAVEAQRAGSHGKGFAVVAEEVRNLAGKSAAASKETAELIEDSIKKVNHGSEIAENTAAALRDIMERVDRIVELIREIAESSDIQAAEAAQIDQALSQVSNVVQTNSATSEECAAACEELSGQAENLRRLLEHYKLRE